MSAPVFFPGMNGSAIGGSPAATCCYMDQCRYVTYTNPSSAIPTTFLQSNASLDLTFNISPENGVHIADNMYLEIPVTNGTGATGMNLVASNIWCVYQYAMINTSVVQQNWCQPDAMLYKVAYPPEIQTVVNQSIGVDANYRDAYLIPPSTTQTTRIPLRNIFTEQKFPLWLPGIQCSVLLRVLGGTQLLNDTYSLITNLQSNTAGLRLIIDGLRLTDTAKGRYAAKLIGTDKNGSQDKIYQFVETQQYIYGLPTLSTSQNTQLTVQYNNVGNLLAGFAMISPSTPTGAQLSYGTTPIVASDLLLGGTSLVQQLGNFSFFSQYQNIQNSAYLRNLYPMVLNNMYFLSFTDNPLSDIMQASCNGMVYSNGLSLNFQILAGPSTGAQSSFYFWGFYRSKLTVNFVKGTFTAIRWTA